MLNSIEWPKTLESLQLLRDKGLSVNEAAFGVRLLDFQRLCSTWNPAAKLMSRGDLKTGFDEHVADSLSLVTHVAGSGARRYVDIGTGGGFPAIPIWIVLRDLQTYLVERSATKCEYLRQIARQWGAKTMSIIEASFPCEIPGVGPTLYTARAVENPEKIHRDILANLRAGDTYLVLRLPPRSDSSLEIELVNDEFTRAGLRRSVLYKILG